MNYMPAINLRTTLILSHFLECILLTHVYKFMFNNEFLKESETKKVKKIHYNWLIIWTKRNKESEKKNNLWCHPSCYIIHYCNAFQMNSNRFFFEKKLV